MCFAQSMEGKTDTEQKYHKKCKELKENNQMYIEFSKGMFNPLKLVQKQY